MNSRTTTIFFGLLLTTLFVFGLMVARKKNALDQSAIVPTLQSPDVKIDKVVIAKTGDDKAKEQEVQFVQIDDRWYLKEGNQQVRVEGFRVDEIIRAVKDAKNDETADITKELSAYGLKSPSVVVTLFGKDKDKESKWQFFVGKEGADKTQYYVNSSDRPDKAYVVAKRSIESLFVKNPNYLRSKRLFDFVSSGVSVLDIKRGQQELELKRGQNNLWSFVKPALGFAGFESSDEKKDDKSPLPKDNQPISGVKGLIDAILKVRVEDDDDFVPLGKSLDTYDLETEKAPMRIDITTAEKEEKKGPVVDTLLIGRSIQTPKGKFYFARLSGDDGVMKVSAKYLEPLDKALDNPGKIRSLDVASFDTKNIDVVYLKQGKDEIKFFRPDHDFGPWQMFVGNEQKKTFEPAMMTLLDQVLGKKAIVEFDDVPEADVKKADAQWGLDGAEAIEITLFERAIDREKKDDKKDEAKDEKKDDKKDEKKQEKKDVFPKLKADAKPLLTLAVGKPEKEVVHVRRTLAEGIVSRFTMKKEFVEKIAPPEGIVLAYMDRALPSVNVADVVSIDLVRMKDKETEKLDLEQRKTGDNDLWYIKDSLAPGGVSLADSARTGMVANMLTHLEALRWIKKLDPKDDLAKYGLKDPVVVATIGVKKNSLTREQMDASVIALLSSDMNPVVVAAVSAAALPQAYKKESVTIKFGKETDKEKDKEKGVYALHSGSDLLFLVAPGELNIVKNEELRDRSSMLNAQAEMTAALVANVAGDPMGALLLGMPLVTGPNDATGLIHNFDPDKVKEIKLAVRTPYELRSFAFAWNAKDKTWTDASSLQEFKIDSAKVTELVKELAKLRTGRFAAFVGGARGEHKLGKDEANLKIDLVMDNGPTVTLTVGAAFANHGYFATSSLWPGAVFFLPATTIDPLRAGPSYFGKTRTAAN